MRPLAILTVLASLALAGCSTDEPMTAAERAADAACAVDGLRALPDGRCYDPAELDTEPNVGR